jgi:hypothetical protein
MPSSIRKPPPFPFVLEMLEPIEPLRRSMFGCLALYVGEKIVLILREKEDHPRDNGVWIATTSEHHASLKKDFPSMRSIELFGTEGPTSWQNLPADALDFEESAERVCKMVIKGDSRIGKIPKRKKLKKKKSLHQPASHRSARTKNSKNQPKSSHRNRKRLKRKP